MSNRTMRNFSWASLCAAGLVFIHGATAATVTVNFTITRVVELQCDEGFGEACPNDFYSKVEIDNQGLVQSAKFCNSCSTDFHPNWAFSRSVDTSHNPVPIHVELWDQDDLSADDQIDIANGPSSLDLTVDLNTCRWQGGGLTGSVNIVGSSSGSGLDSAQIFFLITTTACGDSDGDGLLDLWEINGFDADGDGNPDVDLPGMGADPNHKDLFLELDTVAGQAPTRAGIQAMKAAFAAAPITAGSTASTQAPSPNGGQGVDAPPNPDGLPGINLWVDTGNLTDPTASEDGGPAGSCSDGIDNGPDGVTDAADPDCLVGDNLGGGNIVPRVGCLDSAFYTVKASNFNANRQSLFRYAINGNPADNNPCGGGRGEIGGNDFVEFNHDGGTIMHELGHTLNLHHGGNVDGNCHPNYVSVMNYDNQFGINQAGGGTIFDYSPPRFAGGRGIVPLPQLTENNLNEATILDPTDAVNRFVFVNGLGQKIQSPLNQPVDWDGDGNTTDPPPLTVNIDTSGATGRPAACSNGTNNGTFNSFDDWSNISLAFAQFGDSANAAINPELEREQTYQELLELQQELNTTEVAITKMDSPDPVVAGEDLKYTLTIRNNGPNPATQVQVVDMLPSGVSYESDNGGCVQAPAGKLTCNAGDVPAGQTKSIEITALVAADLVYNAGAPTTITNTATTMNLAGPDLDPSNNNVSEDTKVVAKADLAIVSFEPVGPPAEILVNQDVQITMRKVITDLGPSVPMDVKLTKVGAGPPDCTITPLSATENALAVGLNEQRVVDEVFTISCTGPSRHTFTFMNDIEPLRPDDTDPDLTNNHADSTFVIELVVPVTINIKPGSDPNSISTEPGGSAIAVAVLTTKAGEYGNPLAFNAATIDPLSVRFGPRNVVFPGLGGGSEIHRKGHLADAPELDEKTTDQDLDMVLHFAGSETGIAPGDTEACVKGQWIDGNGERHKFFGCDAIRVIK